MKSIKVLFFVFFIITNLQAQDKPAFGASLMYNFPLSTVGFGLRGQIPLSNRLLVVPQVKYAPGFNEIHELYAGTNIHFLLLTKSRNIGYQKSIVEPQKPNLYLAAGVAYNRWINYFPSINSRAKQNNIIPEVGGGLTLGSLVTRFFVEGKYNILWNESYGEVGLLFYPAYIKINKRNSCPKIF